MLKLRLVISALVLFAVASVGQAQITNAVSIGGHDAHPSRMLAKFKKSASSQSKSSLLQRSGLKIAHQYKLVSGLVVLDDTNPDAAKGSNVATGGAVLGARIQELEASGLFEYVEPDYVVKAYREPTDGFFTDGSLWGLRNTGISGGTPGIDVNATNAWELTIGSSDVVVAVIDTGVRYTHIDLRNRMWINADEIPDNGIDDDLDGYVDNVHGIDAFSRDGDPMDEDDHGTHVSGTIGAEANGGGSHVGVAWDVRIMALRFLGPFGGFTSGGIECIDFAVSEGVKISNNSWGGGGYSQALYDSIARARLADHLFVSASGNDALNNDQILDFPGSFNLDNILNVAAIDRAGNLADFSNYGRTTVDVGAPGVEILSSVSAFDGAYASFQGTSMASPHVAGVAALILSYYPTADYFELKTRIMRSAVPLPSLQGRTVTGGRVDAYAALTVTGDGILEMSVTPPDRDVLLGGQLTPIYALVTDIVPVRDAEVIGFVEGSSQVINFVNDGSGADEIAGNGVYTGELMTPNAITNIVLTVIATAPSGASVTNVMRYEVVPPPPNDFFADASKIPAEGTLLISNNRFGTTQGGEPDHAGVDSFDKTLWWNWSPAANTSVIVDTAGSGFDTVLAVYTGSSVSSLTPVASVNDIAGKRQGYVTFDAKAGVTYRIVVGGATSEDSGLLRLRLLPGGRPDTNGPIVNIVSPLQGAVTTVSQIVVEGNAIDPQPSPSGVSQVFVLVNDELVPRTALGTTNWSAPILLISGSNVVNVTAVDFAGNISAVRTLVVNYVPMEVENDLFVNAAPLSGGYGTVTVTNINARTEFGEPPHAANEGGKSVWWSFRPETDGILELSTEGSDFDTLIGVYTGIRLSSLVTVASNDDALAGVSFSKVTFPVIAGTTYKIAVDGYGGASGVVILEYSFAATSLFNLTVSTEGEGQVVPGSGPFEIGSTVVLTATPAEGHDFLSWSGDASSYENPLSVVVSTNLNLVANFAPRAPADDFETGDLAKLPWTNTVASAANWTIQSTNVAAGSFSAVSGRIGDGQRSALVLKAKFRAGQGSFDFRVSSETGWDFLEFYIDGVRQERWSGVINWSSFPLALTAGQHTLEWRYVKDSNSKFGADEAYLDNIRLPLEAPKDESSPGLLSITQQSTGAVQLFVQGQVNQIYVIQASSDLVNWVPISTNLAPHGFINIVDPAASGEQTRFYRAIVP